MDLKQYKIVIPAKYTAVMDFAGEEFSRLFEECTGVRLPIVRESADHTVSAPLISLGTTLLLTQSGFCFDQSLGHDGVCVFVKNGNAYFIGENEQATVFAIYVWMQKNFNLKFFTEGIHTHIVNRDFRFTDGELKEKPDIAYRQVGRNGVESTTPEKMLRYRTGDSWKNWGTFGHTIYDLIPVKKYFSDHPDWFALYNNTGEKPYDNDTDWTPCLTNEGFISEYIEGIKRKLKSFPESTYFSLSQNDGGREMCHCPKCRAALEKYKGSWCGVYLEFANRVSTEVTAYLQKTDPERAKKIRFSLLAYGITYEPPIDPDTGEIMIRPNDNISIMYCPIIGNRATSYFDDEHYELFDDGYWETGNRKIKKALNLWRSACEHVDMWSYGIDCYCFLTPYNMWNTVQQNLIEFKQYGGGSYYYEEATHNEPMTNFNELKAYVEASLEWNVSQNLNTLITEFMQAVYGDKGWRYVYEYFEKCNRHFYEVGNPLDYGKIADTHKGCLDRDHWSLEWLKESYELFEQAVAANETIENAEKRDLYRTKIKIEQLVPIFLILHLYKEEIPDEFFDKLLADFERYGRILGLKIISCGENITFDSALHDYIYYRENKKQSD